MEYATREQAQQAVNTLSNQNLMGRLVYVREVDPLPPRPWQPLSWLCTMKKCMSNLLAGRIGRPNHALPDRLHPAEGMKDHPAEAALAALLMEVHLPQVGGAKFSSTTFVISLVPVLSTCAWLTSMVLVTLQRWLARSERLVSSSRYVTSST